MNTTTAEAPRRILAFIAALFIALTLLGLAGCANAEEDEGPDYADDEAMLMLAKGLEARWDLADAPTYTGTSSEMIDVVDAELECVKDQRNRQFENPKMQEDMLAYINLLEDSIALLESYPQDSLELIEKWEAIYNARATLLNKFANEYDLKVSAPYQEDFKELLVSGKAAQEKNDVNNVLNQLVESIAFEKTDDGYGFFTYTAIVENTTGYNFGNVSMVLALYDAEGVKMEDNYASTSTWAAGEKVRFEAFSSVDAATIKATVQYYDLAE